MPSIIPETRYARSGELSIAYQVVGSGPPDILFIPGFVSNVELMWEVPFLCHYLERLARMGRLVFFDKRGTGLSDRTLGSGSAADRMDDLRAVADAAGIESAAVLGLSEGGPLGILFATTYPERVRSLVLWGTFARIIEAHDYPIGVPASVVGPWVESVKEKWGTGEAWRIFAQNLPEDDDTRRLIARYERQATTPGVAAEILRRNIEMDVRAALTAVQAPTLVVHRLGDPLVDIARGRYLAEHIQGARLVELPGDFHISGRVGEDDDLLDVVEEFVTGTATARERDVDRVLATVLFTDIVDSTARASSLGDRAWTSVLRQHDEIACRQVAHHRGIVVKRTGDGLLATFDGPGRCVRAAQAIRNAMRPLGLDVRAGIHTGEIQRSQDDVAGIAVHIGARIGALAGRGEVLVSSTVKDLVIGSGIDFADRGRHQLKGVPGDWQIWAAVD
jgi:class 3 adenylate cyclase